MTTLVPQRASARTSFIRDPDACAAVTRSRGTQSSRATRTGRRPVFLRWASTSPRVSDRWVWSSDIAPRGDFLRLRVGFLRGGVDSLHADGGRDERIALLLRDECVGVLHRASVLRGESLIEGDHDRNPRIPDCAHGRAISSSQ